MAEAAKATAADMTNDEIDRTVVPVVLDVVRMLTGAGRPDRQAMQDVRRAIDRIEQEYDRGEAAGMATS